jgi:hypothetical protein
VDVAQEQQEQAPVELVDRFVADGELLAQDDLVGAVVEHPPGGGGFGRTRRSGGHHGRDPTGGGQEAILHEGETQSEDDGQVEIGEGLAQPPTAGCLTPGGPDQGAEGQQPAQERHPDQDVQGRGCPMAPEQEAQETGLQERGRQRAPNNVPAPADRRGAARP